MYITPCPTISVLFPQRNITIEVQLIKLMDNRKLYCCKFQNISLPTNVVQQEKRTNVLQLNCVHNYLNLSTF